MVAGGREGGREEGGVCVREEGDLNKSLIVSDRLVLLHLEQEP